MTKVNERMRDRVFEGFLKVQEREGFALAQNSDVLDLSPMGPSPSSRYRATFRCTTFVSGGEEVIEETGDSTVDVWFPNGYLRQADTFHVLSWRGWRGPCDSVERRVDGREIFHPNINSRAGVICIGRLNPGTRLVDILYQVYELLLWRNIHTVESDALDARACDWARKNQERFPLSDRPLTRPKMELTSQEGRVG